MPRTPPDESANWLTAAETRRILRIGEDQLYAALNRGDIPAIRVGRTWRISRAALHQLGMAATPDPPSVA